MLTDVSIVITAGSRPGYLNFALLGLGRYLPECKVVVANDDGYRPARSGTQLDHNVVWKELPKDTWLTKKRNEAVKLVDTKYTLMAADDFNFTVDVRAAVIRMAEILDKYQVPDVVGGTHNDYDYKGFLDWVPGKYLKETRLNEKTDTPFVKSGRLTLWKVDIVPNWFLARTSMLRDYPWDESIGPIGGEHADWFIDLKNANRVVVWTPGLNVYEQAKDSTMENVEYGKMRRRCWDGHKLMLAKRGVKVYHGFDDEVKI
jgi:hypothetical protein